MAYPARILIQGGRVIDPSQREDRVTNLLLEDGRIAAWDVEHAGEAEVISAHGKIVCPGFVDLHAELREPGWEEDETIETGTAAALAGGFTTIACIPNTDPPIDSAATVEFIRQKAARAGNCNVLVLGCVSKNRAGAELAEIGSLTEAGAIGFTDADRPLHNADLLRRALEYCLMFDRPILDHPEDPGLTQGGLMHEGKTSMVLGLSGMPAEAEDIIAGRDIRLAEATGGRLHLMNLSSAGSVAQVRQARARGIPVTAEICPANFSLTDEVLKTFDSNCKVNPPLRSREHVDACIAGLVDGTVEVIASGHAPRTPEKKMRELNLAPFGISSLETTFALVVSRLVAPGHLDWMNALSKLTINPSRVLKIAKGTLQVGADADVTIFDPEARWVVQPERFRSKGSNNPWAGQELRGRIEHVFVGGRSRYRRAQN